MKNSEPAPKLPELYKVGVVLFYTSALMLLVTMATMVLLRMKVALPTSQASILAVFFGMLSSFILLYPTVSVWSVSKEPEKFFTKYLGKYFAEATLLWTIFTGGVVYSFFHQFVTTQPKFTQAEIEASRTAMFPFLCFLLASVAVSVVCLVIVNYYRNYYKKPKVLPKTRE